MRNLYPLFIIGFCTLCSIGSLAGQDSNSFISKTHLDFSIDSYFSQKEIDYGIQLGAFYEISPQFCVDVFLRYSQYHVPLELDLISPGLSVRYRILKYNQFAVAGFASSDYSFPNYGDQHEIPIAVIDETNNRIALGSGLMVEWSFAKNLTVFTSLGYVRQYLDLVYEDYWQNVQSLKLRFNRIKFSVGIIF